MSWPSRRRQERTSATMTTISMQCDRAIDAPSASRAVGVARVKSSRRLPVGPATAPRTSDVEVDHIKVVPHGLRFAYFLPAGPPARETCKNSRRRGVRRQQFQIVILASAHGKKSTNRVEVVSGARELDRVVGEGRAGLASSSGRRKRRGGRGGHSCGSARGDDGRVGALCAPLPV